MRQPKVGQSEMLNENCHKTEGSTSALLRPSILSWLIIAALIWPHSLSAQDKQSQAAQGQTSTDEAKRSSKILIGHEHSEPGPTRYPSRTPIGGQGTMVEFASAPVPQTVANRTPPPRLADLRGNPLRQAALDNNATPGDWVTPPAAW